MAAYTIFYMGINLGANFLSPLTICGPLGEKIGWGYGFGAAGGGMILGLLTIHFHAAISARERGFPRPTGLGGPA